MSDYSKLSDAELSAEVARKVMKWTLKMWNGHEYWYTAAGKRKICVQYWSPATDGRHRDEVLAECERRGWYWTLAMDADGEGYHALIHGGQAMADTPGRAVCLAALAAVRSEDE
jgi:hypothetical protein